MRSFTDAGRVRELASPLDFLPALPGWRDRSTFVSQEGRLTARHFDLYSQASAGCRRDGRPGLADVSELSRLFEAVGSELYWFPAVYAEGLRRSVDELRSTD